LLNFLTIARIEFPWATTRTLLPLFTVGTIVPSQNGITLSIVVLRLSVNGNYSGFNYLYLWSNLGCLSSVSVNGGGGIS
jgi:hypothetical protein